MCVHTSGLTAAQAITALVKYCQSPHYFHSDIEVKAQATLVSCAGLGSVGTGNDTLEFPIFVAKQHSCET